eukprot:jgi/Psemu1/23640/gm1.23640_g
MPAPSTILNDIIPIGPTGTSNSDPTSDPTSTGTSSYTWTYFPSSDSVCFRRVVSSFTPIVHKDIPAGGVSSKPSREPHSTCTCTSSRAQAHSKWSFHPQCCTVTFHRSPKQVSSPQPYCISSLQLPRSAALSKDISVVPSPVLDTSQHGTSPASLAHSTFASLYCLHATPLFANHWLYDNVICNTLPH